MSKSPSGVPLLPHFLHLFFGSSFLFIYKGVQPALSQAVGTPGMSPYQIQSLTRFPCVLECTLDLGSCPPRYRDSPRTQGFRLSDIWLEKLSPSRRKTHNLCPVFNPLTSWLGKSLPYILGFFTIHGKSRLENGISVSCLKF